MPQRDPAPDAMAELRGLFIEARQSERLDELLGGMEDARLEATPDGGGPEPGPADRTLGYGCVVVDTARERVLLRHIRTSGRNVFGWTFSKGLNARPPDGDSLFNTGSIKGKAGGDPEESPAQMVQRNAIRQLGWRVRLLTPLPGWFVGRSFAFRYWLAEADGEVAARQIGSLALPPADEVRWFTWDEAEAAIRLNPTHGADLLILAAARGRHTLTLLPCRSPVSLPQQAGC